MDSPIFRDTFEQNSYELLKDHIGFLIMKPDALDLGIAEDLIDVTVSEFLSRQNICLLHGEIVSIKNDDDLRGLYPHIDDMEVWQAMQNYFVGNDIVVNVLYSKEPQDMEGIIKVIKGPRMRDWEIDQLLGNKSVTQFLRGVAPVAGTIEQMRPLMIKIIECKQQGLPFRLEPHEYAIYSRNLVHSPEGAAEYSGLLNLLSEDTRELILDHVQA